ncbi:phage terminase large subunit family protein [Agrobacterium sp. CNPSo 3708]|uniref:terminase gpA endonuclease subunit n=1 Tax=Agrobacterium sp. CNPSo 3708 TaxID=3028150 RepID=UPI00236338D4|nr:terminase gpA endonuclease subunit [Agrobacterium sp. CNPSo 3708]MDD1499794.1 phage terminase large subunit family protein [Agrobacterium sp. CNPSo 3708]
MTVHPGAIRAVYSALAGAIRLQPPVSFDAWLPKNIILVDGPKKGEFWSAEDAPYLPEIAQCLSQEHPCTEVTVRKSQQTGVSILALAWMLYIAENCPDNSIYGVPGLDALQDINSGKLQPLIDAWQKHTKKTIIMPTTSRSGVGSTTYEKKFPGGALYLANANTVMDLSAKTTRFGVKDEVSKWQALPNGADPENLFFGRFTAFRRQKTYKIFGLSTPELDSGDALGEGPGHCRIDRDFRRSDQRFWYIRCPECGTEQVQRDAYLLIDKAHLHKTVMQCQHCEHHISEMERVVAVREGRYIPTFSGPDRHPGFHVDAFMSLMMSYEAIAEDKLKYEAKGEAGAKDYSNLICGLPYQMKGNAPDHQRLMERREDYPPLSIPAGGLIFVAGADVQSYGIYCEGVAFGEDRQSWNVFAEFFEGATDNPQAGAWLLFERFCEQEFPDGHGVLRKIEAVAVDSGYRPNQVREWCRRRPNAYATKGMPGRGVPAISAPVQKAINKRGKRKRFGGELSWPVGTWALKAELYGNLHKIGLRSGEASDPSGYCHFHMDLGEEYFQQLTSEYFTQKLVKGKLHEEWALRREHNHFLDCRIYAMAIAEHLGLSRMTKSQWAALRAKLEPVEPIDLLSTESQKAAAAEIPENKEAASTPVEIEIDRPGNAPVKPTENRWKKRR